MAPEKNFSLILASYPHGEPIPGKDLVIKEDTIDLSTAEPPVDGIITKNLYFSFDPYMRGRMRDPKGSTSYMNAFELNKPITNHAISSVVKSSSPAFKQNDLIHVRQCPFENYTTLNREQISQLVQPLENPLDLDPKLFLGPLGMPGATAYSSLYEIGQPKGGEVIFISAASGAVGALVGQLAKREGLKVIGSVGSDEKLKYILDDLKFDAGFNYKKEAPDAALKRLAPDGIDIYYENVGGEHMDAALASLKLRGRIIACGMVSQYNKPAGEQYGVKNLALVVGKRLTIRGFLVSDADFWPKYAEEHQRNVQKWLKEGSVSPLLSVTKGLENGAQGFIGMLRGENFGKAVLAVGEP